MKSRGDRYKLVPDNVHEETFQLRVYSAVSVVGDYDYPADRAWEMQQIYSSPDFIADVNGAGGVWQRNSTSQTFYVSPIAKLSMLGIIKFSTLDPMGMGVEMEGGKPGWNDAMNGLPGLIGSGMAETYEMLRIVRYVKSSISKYSRSVIYPVEFGDFMATIRDTLTVHEKSDKSERAEFLCWDACNTARERYRERISVVFSGATIETQPASLLSLLEAMEVKTLRGIDRALASTNGLSPSYFHFECLDSEEFIDIKNNTHSSAPQHHLKMAHPHPQPHFLPDALPRPQPHLYPPPFFPAKLRCNAFKTHFLPNFLEGPVRHMKTLEDKNKRLAVYHHTRNSGMYDSTLRMYRLSESLESMAQDVGRMKAFSPGWLENQSIWLHMSYKFYLELLKGGLYDEFFHEVSTGLVPFMDSKVYGRSPLEAASFIVSTAFPDKKLHGASFLARLTGSTAEMMSMWGVMMAGHKPFTLHGNVLTLDLQPVLPGWLFTDSGIVSFTFLGGTKVTYHNHLRMDSWMIVSKSSKVTFLDESIVTFVGSAIKGVVAERVRALEAASIDVYY